MAVHGVIGGISSVLSGGKFGHGFASAGFTAAATTISGAKFPKALGKAGARVVVNATIRGTASKLSGGKFANGAITAAFASIVSSAADAAITRSRGGTAANGRSCAPPLQCASAQDQKAVEALAVANPQSTKDNLEYGGYVYQSEDGTFGYTSPLAGTDQGFNPSSAAHLVPEGATIVDDYHTHADYSLVDPQTGAAIMTSDPARDAFNSDHFSSGDYRGITIDAGGNFNYRGYLGTPSGTFRAYDPVGGREYEIY